MNMNDNIGLNDFIERISIDHRLAVFADYQEISNEKMAELASMPEGTVVEFRRFSIDGSPVGPKNIACEIKLLNTGDIHFNFYDATGLYAKTNDSQAAALIAAYCGMVVFDKEDRKSEIEKFVDSCKQDIHKVFYDICGGVSHTDAGPSYSINGISCEIQPLRDTDGQNFYVFSVVKTGEQIDVVSDPVFAAMCAIKYGMVEGFGGKVEKQNTPIAVLREISENADQVIAKCLQISDNEYRGASKSGYYSKDWSYGHLNVMVSISAHKTNFRLSRTIENIVNEPVLTTTDNEVFAHALKRYGIHDLACGLTKEPQIDTPVPKLKSMIEAQIGEQALQQFETTDKYESKKPIKHQTLKEKIDAHNDELANQIILQYHEGLINSIQMAEQFQALRNNMLDTFASYSLA